MATENQDCIHSSLAFFFGIDGMYVKCAHCQKRWENINETIREAYHNACILAEDSKIVSFEYHGFTYTVKPARLGKTVERLRSELKKARTSDNLTLSEV